MDVTLLVLFAARLIAVRGVIGAADDPQPATEAIKANARRRAQRRRHAAPGARRRYRANGPKPASWRQASRPVAGARERLCDGYRRYGQAAVSEGAGAHDRRTAGAR